MQSRSTSFGRDSEFNSSTDAVVRVQAGRLRELLAQYYATEGRHDPIRLVIPRGSYVPAYEEMPADRPAQDYADAASAVPDAVVTNPVDLLDKPPLLKPGVGMGQVRLLWGGLALVAVLLVAVAYHRPSGHVSTMATTDPAVQEAPMQTAAIADRSPCRKRCRPSACWPKTTIRRRSVSLPSSRRRFSGFDTLDLIDSDFADQPAVGARPYGLCADGGAAATSRAVSASS